MKKFLLSIAAMALFAAPSFAQELADNQQEIETEFYVANDWATQDIKTYECVLTHGEGNTYTLSNVFNSGADLVFSFDLSEIDGAGWVPVHYHESEFVKENVEAALIDYILRLETTWTVTNMSGEVITLNRVCFRSEDYNKENDSWSYSAWIHPEDNPDGDWYDYQAQLFYWADATTGWLESHYMTFLFDETPEGDAAVAKVEIDGDGPVEIYNLQGQKVANPSNGLYIVRQGKKVQKVMVK